MSTSSPLCSVFFLGPDSRVRGGGGRSSSGIRSSSSSGNPPSTTSTGRRRYDFTTKKNPLLTKQRRRSSSSSVVAEPSRLTEEDDDEMNDDENPMRIAIVTSSSCKHCKRAKSALDKMSLAYLDVDVDSFEREESGERILQLSKSVSNMRTIPQI